MEARMQRWLGVGGLVFVAMFVVSTVIAPAPPSSHATAANVVSYYHQHKTAIAASAYIIELAILEGVFFFWFLRERVCAVAVNRALANIGFAGAVLFAVSGGLIAGIQMCLSNAVDHVDPTVMQTLNVLSNSLNGVITSAGVAVLLVATGIALIRSATLPVWLGWIGIVLSVVSLVLPGVGGPAVALWILIASIVILVRAGRAAPAPVA